MEKNKKTEPSPGKKFIYCRYFKHYRTKRIIHASDYGKEFFRFEVKDR